MRIVVENCAGAFKTIASTYVPQLDEVVFMCLRRTVNLHRSDDDGATRRRAKTSRLRPTVQEVEANGSLWHNRCTNAVLPTPDRD